jgi:hypothetical protein
MVDISVPSSKVARIGLVVCVALILSSGLLMMMYSVGSTTIPVLEQSGEPINVGLVDNSTTVDYSNMSESKQERFEQLIDADEPRVENTTGFGNHDFVYYEGAYYPVKVGSGVWLFGSFVFMTAFVGTLVVGICSLTVILKILDEGSSS